MLLPPTRTVCTLLTILEFYYGFLLPRSLHSLPHTLWTLPPAQGGFFSSSNEGEEQKCVAKVWERGKRLCKSWLGKYKNYSKVANQESNSPRVKILKKRHFTVWMQQSNKNIPWICASKVLTRLWRLKASDIELNFLYCMGYTASRELQNGKYFSVDIVWNFDFFFPQSIVCLGGITRDNIQTCIENIHSSWVFTASQIYEPERILGSFYFFFSFFFFFAPICSRGIFLRVN